MLKHAPLGDASPVEVREAESVGGPLAVLDEYYDKYVTCPDDAQYRLDWIEDYFTPDMHTEYVYPNVFMNREDTEEFERLYRAYQKEISLSERVEEFLDYCKAHNIFIAILTNGRTKSQYAKVIALDLHRWFDDDHIFISGGIGYQKPDPMAFQYIEKMFSLNPEETWYIGDTYEADVVGADGAGWHTVWFNHRNREHLENCADVTVTSIEELSRFIRERS